MTNYKWELKQKETSVFSNDIKELQRLQGELGGFIFKISQGKLKT